MKFLRQAQGKPLRQAQGKPLRQGQGKPLRQAQGMQLRHQWRRPHPAFIGLLLVTGLACGMIGFIKSPALLGGPSYWAAETSTPVPTVTVFLGTSTPVYPDTPVPGVLTVPPEWTTVTATSEPPWATATATSPFSPTATALWVTTTPVWITETPAPPWTTTPGLPLIGFTTPEPLETPYYRVGAFYMNSDVYVGGPNGLVFRVTGHEAQPSPRQSEAAYHFITIEVTNYSDSDVVVPVSDLFFIRRVSRDGHFVTGRWVAQNEPLIAQGLPGYETQQLDPIPPDGRREFVLGFVLPAGDVPELGLITNWQRPVEGGLPIWFYLENDPLGPLNDAYKPPPPTPVVLDDTAVPGGDGGPGYGGGMWPTTGYVTRGYGCAALYTGIDGAGWGCPPEQPWFHNGVDIANAQGAFIWTPVDGVVEYAGPNPTGPDCSAIPGSQPPHNGLGNYQRLRGADESGTETVHYFGHLSGFFVLDGPVSAGQVTAEMGSTGCSTGPHLHWIVYRNGHLIDPALWAGPGP
jgi:murein DD-endopeptidase MepM/ murein hydrolase activator NlpD